MRERFRLRFHFWLDMNKPDEAALAEAIDDLKQRRSFAAAVRDGIRLVVSLSRGETSVLQALFPGVLEDAYLAGVVAAKEEFDGAVADRLDELAAVVHQLKPSQTPLVLPAPAGSLPAIDDVDIEIKTASSSADNNANWNFMISSALTVYGSVSVLSPEIIEYGLRTGRLTPKQVGWVGDKKDIRQSSGGNPKAMNVPQFEVPSFDGVEFEKLGA